MPKSIALVAALLLLTACTSAPRTGETELCRSPLTQSNYADVFKGYYSWIQLKPVPDEDALLGDWIYVRTFRGPLAEAGQREVFSVIAFSRPAGSKLLRFEGKRESGKVGFSSEVGVQGTKSAQYITESSDLALEHNPDIYEMPAPPADRYKVVARLDQGDNFLLTAIDIASAYPVFYLYRRAGCR